MILYTAFECHDCDVVKEKISELNIEIEIKELKTQEEIIDSGLFAFPALVGEGEIIAYGLDILSLKELNP